MTMYRLTLSFILATLCTIANAQHVHVIREALAARTGYNYGREAVYTDKLAYMLFNKKIKTPVSGESIQLPGIDTTVKWQAIQADSANRIILRGSRRDFFRVGGSYYYFTYTSPEARPALVKIEGSHGFFLNGVQHAGDPYMSGWMKIPVQLNKGVNEFFVRAFAIIATLEFPEKAVQLFTADITLPSIVAGEDNSRLTGAIVIQNTGQNVLTGLQIESNIKGKSASIKVPSIPAMSTRKVPFHINASGIDQTGDVECVVSIKRNNAILDTAHFIIDAPEQGKSYKQTFISAIDGSVQYYAVTPQDSGVQENAALFFSVHGAGVEAISQARAYKPKRWGTLVAPTNRRPRGFNWEDWGRLDALEVLHIAKNKFEPAEESIYLTGHSMGGHGTWFLGATYPDKWAAIAPCAGYPTLKGYGSADGLIPDSSSTAIGSVLLKAANQSDVIRLASNYKPLGVYIFHGDSDRVVSVDYARQMKKVLSDFHSDMSYYEYPGGSHWFGDQSVDWPPLFDYFSWHKRANDSSVNVIDFATFNPGISSSYRWAGVYQQQQPLDYSRINIKRDIKKRTITGATQNVAVLMLHMNQFSTGATIQIALDSMSPVKYTTKSANDSVFLKKELNNWTVISKPAQHEKNPQRNGTFKDAFRNNMVFVYGTKGSKDENEWSLNKAKFDAETWYYRGNGAVDIVADHQFKEEAYKDRGVILYGNKTTNAAWTKLLSDCPIQVERNNISIGEKRFTGDAYGGYFVWPLRNSGKASVAVVTGSGLKGMNAASGNQYFAGASGFPDYMIFTSDMLYKGVDEVKAAGFFSNNWKLSESEK